MRAEADEARAGSGWRRWLRRMVLVGMGYAVGYNWAVYSLGSKTTASGTSLGDEKAQAGAVFMLCGVVAMLVSRHRGERLASAALVMIGWAVLAQGLLADRLVPCLGALVAGAVLSGIGMFLGPRLPPRNGAEEQTN